MAKGRPVVLMDSGRKYNELRAGARVAATAVLLFAIKASPAQNPAGPPSKSAQSVQERFLVSKFPDKPSLSPTFTVPVEPLGFSPPGDYYLGARVSQVSLDFLDEDRLLFTFRIPGLLHRDTPNGEASSERQIRAVVLKLPQGTVETEAAWTLHDRLRYLWMLKDGHFLVRDRNNLLQGDDSLTLKPLLDFPGSLLSVEIDPEQRYLVTCSREPVARPKASPSGEPGQVASPPTASAAVTTDEDSSADASPDLVVRILRRDTGQVMLVSRVRTLIHLPINSTAYVENLRAQGAAWLLNLNYFTGGSHLLGRVDSACLPTNDFLSENELLVTGCSSTGESRLSAMTTSGQTLWQSVAPATEVWPRLIAAPNGSRMAWTTLDLDHPISAFAPIAAEDIKAQSVTVFDAATGDIALVSPLSPILDGGGNVAISPSGRRVALLNAGSIQVFDLPAPPPLPASSH